MAPTIASWIIFAVVVAAARSAASFQQQRPAVAHRIRSRPAPSSVITMSHNLPDTDGASSSSAPHTRRIVLIGGGHAHVQVIKALNSRSRPSHLHVTLVDLQSSASYSGMVPGCVSKLYTLDQVQIDLGALAGWSGIEFVQGRVTGMSFEGEGGEGGRKAVIVEEDGADGSVSRKEIPFDVVSVDIGSTTRDFASIGGASEHAISTRPISDLVRRIEREEELLKEKLSRNELPNGARVVVVGGGAAGVELSLALRARWDDLLDSKLSVTLVDSNGELLPSESPACRSALRGVMSKYRVEVLHNLIVDEVTSSHVKVSSNADGADGKSKADDIPYTHCIWATGAEAHDLAWALNEQCGLSVTDRGWIRVNHHMQSVSHPCVFAAGDCCEIVSGDGRRSPPKAGVYAVRSGPILIENLTRYLGSSSSGAGDDLIEYRPQDDFLKLLMCGDGTALGFRFGVPLYGRWVWELKDHIDVMFMNLFDTRYLPSHDGGSAAETETGGNTDEKEAKDDGGGEDDAEYDTSQYDTYEAADERPTAEDAGKLLLRRDDGVDFQRAWGVLREMMADDTYRDEVLDAVRGSPDVWW